MARRDIAGLLTGIPSSGGGSFAEVMTQGARQMGGLMGRYGKGVFTGDSRSNEQRLADSIKNFDSATPEAQKDLIGRLQASGQSSVAAQLVGQLKEKQTQEQQETFKKGLLQIARAQDNQNIVDFIEAGGSLSVAGNKLLSDKTEKVPSYQLTDKDVEEYELYFKDIDEDYLETIGYDTPVWGKIDKTDKMKLFTKAEQLFSLDRSLGREGAFKQALALRASGNKVDDSSISEPTSGPQKRKDRFSSIKAD